jgi:hypothetical protein
VAHQSSRLAPAGAAPPLGVVEKEAPLDVQALVLVLLLAVLLLVAPVVLFCCVWLLVVLRASCQSTGALAERRQAELVGKEAAPPLAPLAPEAQTTAQAHLEVRGDNA